jgi:alpha-mannosidase
MAEDIPCSWDNWDVDADTEYKFKDCSNLVSREVISTGDVAYIIRSEYKLSKKSTLRQDMIFFADSAEVRFDTAMDWNDDWRFLKTFFDTGVYDDFARHDIQFGCAKRPTTRNNSLEQAKFEVVNHKYTDLSETSFGVSILNDCKYGISTNGGTLALSLHKGGHHPDVNGDKDGIHVCTYSFLPHMGSFSSENVIRPAYELNVPVVETTGACSLEKLASVSAPNIFVEAVKPCEDAEKAYIVRLYEAEGTYTNATVSFAENAKHAQITNMLEEVQSDLPDGDSYALTFRPFEIKTIKVTY